MAAVPATVRVPALLGGVGAPPAGSPRPEPSGDLASSHGSSSASGVEPREAGDVVNIRYSKGDQAGVGQKVAALAVPGSDYCPISALRRWLHSASIASGPLFRRVARNGAIGDTSLSDKTVVRLVKSCAGAAGFNAARYSGHSLRRGFLTSAAMNGADVLKMVAQSRHADINTLLEYVEDRQLFDNHAGQRLLKQQDRVPEENE